MEKEVTAAVIGAGNRSNTYLEYAVKHPEFMRLTAVAEPNDLRRDRMAEKFGVPGQRCFKNWKEFLALPKMADAVIIGTADHLHYEPAMAAMEKGYHILLEKPIAQTWKECRDILCRAREKGVIVGVCHVLRYHPAFVQMKALIDAGALGEIVNIRHEESVGIERMTHAFVRGIWKREKETAPLILSKSCHDIDLILWLTGCKCRMVSSMGSLKWFRPENAPERSTLRCLDCPVEKECPYSAVELYLRKRSWLRHFDLEGGDQETLILRELRESDYGRCVYRCGNDVADHQSTIMELENGITVAFTINGITKESMRQTHIMGSAGEITGNESRFVFNDYRKGKEIVYDFSDDTAKPFHAGADLALMDDFIGAVRKGNGANLRVSIERSTESHLVAFIAERSRKERRTLIISEE